MELAARRILVYGVTGSGKTRLAERLGRATGIPWHAVDDLTWESGWVAVPDAIQRERIAEICARPEWILDSAYSTWVDLPLAHVELIIGLDYPRWFTLQRLTRRTLARAIDRRPICNGNRESWRGMISSDSILLWHHRSFQRKRDRIRAWEQDPAAPAMLRFSSARQTEAWLARLAAADG